MAARAPVERRRVRVSGVVQGVGFRPFVDALAHSHALATHMRHDGECVVAELEGERGALDGFAAALRVGVLAQLGSPYDGTIIYGPAAIPTAGA